MNDYGTSVTYHKFLFTLFDEVEINLFFDSEPMFCSWDSTLTGTKGELTNERNATHHLNRHVYFHCVQISVNFVLKFHTWTVAQHSCVCVCVCVPLHGSLDVCLNPLSAVNWIMSPLSCEWTCEPIAVFGQERRIKIWFDLIWCMLYTEESVLLP